MLHIHHILKSVKILTLTLVAVIVVVIVIIIIIYFNSVKHYNFYRLIKIINYEVPFVHCILTHRLQTIQPSMSSTGT